MRYRKLLPHNGPILDAFVAAVPPIILGLSLSFIVQAPVVSSLAIGHTPSFRLRSESVLRSRLSARLNRRMTAETVLAARHLPGLPLVFFVPGRSLALGSLVLGGAALVLILISIYLIVLDSSITSPERLPFEDGPIPVVIESSGRLQKVYVTRGSVVHTGDPIVQLDTRHLLVRKHELESLIHAAETNASDSSSDAADLYKELEEIQLDLNRLTVTSPVDGKILSLASLYPGKTLPAGAAIAVVVRSKMNE